MRKKNYQSENLSFKKIDCKKIPLKDNSLDAVVSFETIEHISGYQEFLKEVERVLKKGGLFLCSSPNKEITSPFSKPGGFHVKEFYISELANILKKRGFSIKGIYGQLNKKKDIKFYLKHFFGPYLIPLIKRMIKRTKKQRKFKERGNLKIFKISKKKRYSPTYFLILSKYQ